MDKLPTDLVKMSVHSRIITRGDSGEAKPLMDKGGGKRNNDGAGYERRATGRGRGGDRGEGRYNDRHHGDRGERGGRGRGGRGGFETRAPGEMGPPGDSWGPVNDEARREV